jgi:signal peptidase II
MKRKYWVLLIACLLILILDQFTKYEVEQKLPLHHRVEVISNFFNLTHVRNAGGAFGIFGGRRGGWGTVFFVGISVLAIGSLFYFIWKVKEDEKNLNLSFSLVLAGAIGNLIDRLRYGEVIDFLEFYLSSFYWPAFNIADSAICIGIGLMAFEILIWDHKKAAKSRTLNPK